MIFGRVIKIFLGFGFVFGVVAFVGVLGVFRFVVWLLVVGLFVLYGALVIVLRGVVCFFLRG